jgi:hypothetical protein
VLTRLSLSLSPSLSLSLLHSAAHSPPLHKRRDRPAALSLLAPLDPNRRPTVGAPAADHSSSGCDYSRRTRLLLVKGQRAGCKRSRPAALLAHRCPLSTVSSQSSASPTQPALLPQRDSRSISSGGSQRGSAAAATAPAPDGVGGSGLRARASVGTRAEPGRASRPAAAGRWPAGRCGRTRRLCGMATRRRRRARTRLRWRRRPRRSRPRSSGSGSRGSCCSSSLRLCRCLCLFRFPGSDRKGSQQPAASLGRRCPRPRHRHRHRHRLVTSAQAKARGTQRVRNLREARAALAPRTAAPSPAPRAQAGAAQLCAGSSACA